MIFYTKQHEWIKKDGSRYLLGISAYAISELGDITYVELPDTHRTLKAGETFSVVESVKAASDIYMPVDGTIIEVNQELENSPELLSKENTWICAIDNINTSQIKELLEEKEYQKFINSKQ